MTRLILRNSKLSIGRLRIPPQAARHARVARVSWGETLELLDLAGTVAEAKLLSWTPDGGCEVEIFQLSHGRGEPPFPLVLGLGILHTSAFDWAVEKATELGVTALIPLITARVQSRDHQGRVSRWQRVAEAAVAQCGRSRAPEVAPPMLLEKFLGQFRGLVVVADFAGQPWIPSALLGEDGVAVLVGPEGGFTPEEREALHQSGVKGLFLGPRTLRAETAAVVALSLVQSQLGWWTR